MAKKICIYHGNCADGFAAAWVVRKALDNPVLSSPSQVEYYPGKYQEPPPDVAGKDVILVDFSYKRPVIEKMIEIANSVLILDHHITAIDDLQNLPGLESVFDIHRSGAMIAWDYYFPDQSPPKLLEHIQDRDLWKFLLEGTREIQATIFSYPYDFSVWDILLNTPPASLMNEGQAIERKHFKDINELLPVVTKRMVIGEYNVPVANLPYTFVSDAANILAENEPFAGCYWDTSKGRVFGLRSHEGRIDVSQIATLYGGGGHKHASGFTVSFEDAAKFEIEKSLAE